MGDDRIVFLDLETTGLDHEQDEILELGIVVTDKDLVPQTVRSWLVLPRRIPVAALVNRHVYEMHKTSGLLDELMVAHARNDSQLFVDRVEENVIAYLSALDFVPQEAVLGGYSIQFDRQFIATHMPSLHRYLSHRMIDVSTLRSLWKRWMPVDPPKQEQAHRSIRDCQEAIAELRYYREHMLVKPTATDVAPAPTYGGMGGDFD